MLSMCKALLSSVEKKWLKIQNLKLTESIHESRDFIVGSSREGFFSKGISDWFEIREHDHELGPEAGWENGPVLPTHFVELLMRDSGEVGQEPEKG